MSKETLTVGLVKGRHQMPVDEYIFEKIEDVLDFDGMNNTINSFIEERVGVTREQRMPMNSVYCEEIECYSGIHNLRVYVTGLTAATAAVIGACARNGVRLSLMHFDASTSTYKEQVVL